MTSYTFGKTYDHLQGGKIQIISILDIIIDLLKYQNEFRYKMTIIN